MILYFVVSGVCFCQEAEVSKRSCSGESCNVKVAREDRDGDMNFQQQWQINLMDHIEAVQDEVIHRMDFIERELDGNLNIYLLIYYFF